jgi:hypothetical protein
MWSERVRPRLPQLRSSGRSAGTRHAPAHGWRGCGQAQRRRGRDRRSRPASHTAGRRALAIPVRGLKAGTGTITAELIAVDRSKTHAEAELSYRLASDERKTLTARLRAPAELKTQGRTRGLLAADPGLGHRSARDAQLAVRAVAGRAAARRPCTASNRTAAGRTVDRWIATSISRQWRAGPTWGLRAPMTITLAFHAVSAGAPRSQLFRVEATFRRGPRRVSRGSTVLALCAPRARVRRSRMRNVPCNLRVGGDQLSPASHRTSRRAPRPIDPQAVVRRTAGKAGIQRRRLTEPARRCGATARSRGPQPGRCPSRRERADRGTPESAHARRSVRVARTRPAFMRGCTPTVGRHFV